MEKSEELARNILQNVFVQKKKKTVPRLRNVNIISLDQYLLDFALSVTYGIMFFPTNTNGKAIVATYNDFFEFVPIERFPDVVSGHICEYCYLIAANDADGNKCQSANVIDIFQVTSNTTELYSNMNEKIYKYKMKLK
jgi:hypothetical protein